VSAPVITAAGGPILSWSTAPSGVTNISIASGPTAIGPFTFVTNPLVSAGFYNTGAPGVFWQAHWSDGSGTFESPASNVVMI
jgi:hypothetical protein